MNTHVTRDFKIMTPEINKEPRLKKKKRQVAN